MFADSPAFSGFSVNNLEAAETFYGQTLGLEVENTGMGLLLHVRGGHPIFVYEKSDHQPATYTILNFPVDDIDKAVDVLAAQGIGMIRYDGQGGVPSQDGKGVLRGRSANMGPDIAWFNDPAGNVLAILQD